MGNAVFTNAKVGLDRSIKVGNYSSISSMEYSHLADDLVGDGLCCVGARTIRSAKVLSCMGFRVFIQCILEIAERHGLSRVTATLNT